MIGSLPELTGVIVEKHRAAARRGAIVVAVSGIDASGKGTLAAFLFRRALRHRYDLSIWVDCSFEAALMRALARNQEGLPPERLLADYRRIYFPAQEIHLRRDRPRDFADVVVPGDLELRAGSIHSQNS